MTFWYIFVLIGLVGGFFLREWCGAIDRVLCWSHDLNETMQRFSMSEKTIQSLENLNAYYARYHCRICGRKMTLRVNPTRGKEKVCFDSECPEGCSEVKAWREE